jgi:DNA-binding NarL/FixJ family response regulator
LKNTGLLQIVESIKELHEGGSPMSANIARKMVNFFRDKDKGTAFMDILSAREKEILQLLAKGLLYKEIATQLQITTGTVRIHIHKIYEKLHVQNRTEAINKAFGK